MIRAVLLGCWPYLAAIVASVVLLRLLVALSGARLQLRRLRRLHRDQLGGVQSLAFVLTVPVFIIVMMFIAQLSQLTIAKIVVEYAAFAAARSAIVWIPANLGTGDESANRISAYELIGEGTAEDGRVWSVYQVRPAGRKFGKIHLAAAMACMPICPSRDYGSSRDDPRNDAAASLLAAYRAMVPSSQRNPRIPDRLANKLAYALEHTRVSIQVRHKDSEPPLVEYDIDPYPTEFAYNEIGFQDQILVTVTHDFALLPGPGRLLARRVESPAAPLSYSDAEPVYREDRVADHIERKRGLYVYSLTASVRLPNEGEKSVLPYIQNLEGWYIYSEPPPLEGPGCGCDDDGGDPEILPPEETGPGEGFPP